MKRIVMFEGGVETLQYFSHRMAERFRELGYQVFFFDLKDEAGSGRRLRKFIRPRETAMVTFNFQGLENERGVYDPREGYVWDAYGIPCYNIAADHPYFYHDRLRDLPEGYRHISIDRFHQKYFREFYPEFEERGFLPLAGAEEMPSPEEMPSGEAVPSGEGTPLGEEMPLGEAVPSSEGTPYAQAGEERPIDVIFTGNYTELSFFEPYINWINDEYAAFYRGIIDELIACPHKTVEEVALRHCEREMGKVPYGELRGAFHKMIFIDLYVRNYWRGMAVKRLADAGIKVDVVGKGWEKLDVARRENLILHPQTDSASCLLLLNQSKVSVNVMPWFKDGAHDRVFNSVLCGAACVSDRSAYLCGELSEGEGVCYYGLEDLDELPHIVKELLRDGEKRRDTVAKGRGKVQRGHTWAARADTLAGWIEEDAARER